MMRLLSAAILAMALALSNAVAFAAGPDQAKPDQAKPDQVKPDQVKPDQVKPDQVKPDQVKPDQVKVVEHAKQKVVKVKHKLHGKA